MRGRNDVQTGRGRIREAMAALEAALAGGEAALADAARRALTLLQAEDADPNFDRAELAVAGSDAAIWDWSVDTGAIWWSSQLKAMLGVPEDFTPDFGTFLERVHPGDVARLNAALKRTLEEDAPYHIVFRVRREVGGYATIRSTGHLVRAADGAPQRLVGVQIDISREVLLKAEARAIDEVFTLAASAAGLATMRWDVAAGSFRLDARFCAMVERPDLEGRDVPEGEVIALVHPDDRKLVNRELRRIMDDEGGVFSEDHRIVTGGGKVIWVRGHAGWVRPEDGGARTIIGVLEDRTAAKEAEFATAEAKERYELAVTGALIAVFDWDAVNDRLYWSDRFLEILGLSRAEFSGRNSDFISRVHPDDLQDLEAAMAAHVDDGALYDEEFRMRHAGGGWITVRCRGAGRFDADGALLRMSGSVLDVTAEREAERAAEDAMAKIALAAGHAGIGPLEIDLVEGRMSGDESFGRLIGVPDLTSITLKHAFEIVHPDDKPAVRARFEALAEGGCDRFQSEHRVVRPDGGVVWTETVAMVTRRSAGGAAERLSGVVIDHTRRREVERELAHAKQRYDLAVGASHMAIWDQNLITGEVYWSSRMAEILGLEGHEGREDKSAFAGRIHPDDREHVARGFNALVERGEPYDMVCRLKRADGGFAHVRSRAGVLRDEDGAPIRVCGSITDITDEVLARARADLAVEAACLGIWDWDVVTGVMTADERFAEMLGRPWLSEQPGPVEAPLRLIHEDDREAAAVWIDQLQSGQVSRVEFEHRIVRPDGGVVWLGGYASAVESDGQGRPRRILGLFEDRTARKRAQIELYEAKRRYDVAVTGSHAAIWDQDLRRNEIYWSARLGEMLGLGARERTEPLDTFIARTHPDDLEMARRNARKAIDEGGSLDNVLRIRRADGVYRHLRSRAGVLRDETGRPLRLCGSITDVTEEIEAAAEARLAGHRAQMALQAAHLGVWDFDARTGKVTVDETLASLLGAPELPGRALSADEIQSFTHREDLAAVRADLAKLHKGDLPSIGNEHRIVRPDGTEVWVRADVGVAERNPDGSVARLVGIVQDLTGVKLTEELLRKSADAARRANEAKSQFLATMSHEIRTPLNGVLGVVQLLQRTELDARQRRYVDTIAASGRSLAEVIEDVLDISRIEAGKVEMRPEPVMIADILDQAAAASRALAARKGVELSISISGDLTGPVLIDGRRVAQMVSNLVGNAVKFTDEGGVRLRAIRPAKHVLRVEVDDDGPGLPESLHDAVFERFTQADMSHSRPHEGSGLGLAIVRELAQLAGGVAGVRSTPGQGACFWIELPAPDAQRPDAGRADPAAAATHAPSQLRVLVVEDHPVNRAVTAELVSQAGHLCETADCGREALEALGSRDFDLVLLDLHMPNLDGAEVLARIRRGAAGPVDLPVFIVSADATPEARAKTLALGADAYIVKPIDAQRLRRALDTVSNRKREAG